MPRTLCARALNESVHLGDQETSNGFIRSHGDGVVIELLSTTRQRPGISPTRVPQRASTAQTIPSFKSAIS
jgi:hypothetical protein